MPPRRLRMSHQLTIHSYTRLVEKLGAFDGQPSPTWVLDELSTSLREFEDRMEARSYVETDLLAALDILRTHARKAQRAANVLTAIYARIYGKG